MRLLLVLFTLLCLAAGPAKAAPVRVVIDLSSQKMDVSIDGTREFEWVISTGRKGYSTPKGTYHPQRMYEKYRSRKYDNAPMPWSIFFYRGYAIHGTTEIRNLGKPASHGCVRLHPDNAQILFKLVKASSMADTTIVVRD